ncbi:hypothetical protein AB0C27_40600 [Nonomuraea sp. NPDC048882]|uniref:hypothetical protein n=1 Tax=Nonomuraea sp. NPDC048882 TaxID=3154347 RepID=UPI0033F2DB33
MADDYRERCAEAAMNAWYMNAVLCDHSQITPIDHLVDAVLAVRDKELERLSNLDAAAAIQRAEQAETEVARLRAGEAPEPPSPHTTLTPAQWLRCFNDATPEKRLQVIADLQGEVDRGFECFRMNHKGVIEDLRAELTRRAPGSPESDSEPARTSGHQDNPTKPPATP